MAGAGHGQKGSRGFGGGLLFAALEDGMKAEPEDTTEHSPQVWLRCALRGGSQGSTHLLPVTHRVLLWPLAHFILLTVQHRRMDAGPQREGFTELTPTLETSSHLPHSASVAQACLVVRVVGLLLEGSWALSRSFSPMWSGAGSGIGL